MATYTVDWFTTLDGFGTGHEAYWGKDGPELPQQRAEARLRTAQGRAEDRDLAGSNPIFEGLPDIDLELVDSRILDGRMQQLVYGPSLR